ncbi:MAG: NAD-binding protein [Candidatus Thermoplasmatota archaeon]
MKIIIVGGGQTGLRLADILAEREDITIIEKDEDRAKEISNKTSALVIHGDGTEVSVLKDAGIEKADAVIPLTGDDKTNIMISVIAKSENAKKIIPTVNNPENEDLFPKLDIDLFTSVTGAKVSAIKSMLYVYGEARVIGQFSQGEVQIIEINVSKDSELIDKTLDLNRAVFYTIYRDGEFIEKPQDEQIKEEDDILLFVKTKELPSIIKKLEGK